VPCAWLRPEHWLHALRVPVRLVHGLAGVPACSPTAPGGRSERCPEGTCSGTDGGRRRWEREPGSHVPEGGGEGSAGGGTAGGGAHGEDAEGGAALRQARSEPRGPAPMGGVAAPRAREGGKAPCPAGCPTAGAEAAPGPQGGRRAGGCAAGPARGCPCGAVGLGRHALAAPGTLRLECGHLVRMTDRQATGAATLCGVCSRWERAEGWLGW
jgi:hypothetical protein